MIPSDDPELEPCLEKSNARRWKGRLSPRARRPAGHCTVEPLDSHLVPSAPSASGHIEAIRRGGKTVGLGHGVGTLGRPIRSPQRCDTKRGGGEFLHSVGRAAHDLLANEVSEPQSESQHSTSQTAHARDETESFSADEQEVPGEENRKVNNRTAASYKYWHSTLRPKENRREVWRRESFRVSRRNRSCDKSPPSLSALEPKGRTFVRLLDIARAKRDRGGANPYVGREGE